MQARGSKVNKALLYVVGFSVIISFSGCVSDMLNASGATNSKNQQTKSTYIDNKTQEMAKKTDNKIDNFIDKSMEKVFSKIGF